MMILLKKLIELELEDLGEKPIPKSRQKKIAVKKDIKTITKHINNNVIEVNF